MMTHRNDRYATDLRGKTPLAYVTTGTIPEATAALEKVATAVPQLDLEVTFTWGASGTPPLNTPLGVSVLHGAVLCVVQFTDKSNGHFGCAPKSVGSTRSSSSSSSGGESREQDVGTGGSIKGASGVTMAFKLKLGDTGINVRVIADGTTVEGFAACGRAQWVTNVDSAGAGSTGSIGLVADSRLNLSVDVGAWALSFPTAETSAAPFATTAAADQARAPRQSKRGGTVGVGGIAAAAAESITTRDPVNPADWYKCRPGSGPCNPKPKWKPTYLMNESTSMQVCNFSGYQDPATVAKWGLVDFDWENARGDGTASGGWAHAKPMDCEERMAKQVKMQLAAYPDSKSKYMIYRNFVKALPWLTVVREKLADPAYSAWFLNFSIAVQHNHSLSHVPVCDASYNPPLCTHLYHDHILTPSPQSCGKDLHCDVSGIPVGEYLFDFRAANVTVKG